MKKAYLSIAALLTATLLAGCQRTPEDASSSSGSSEQTPSSQEDVFAYSLSVEAPAKTTFDVGDTFDFAAVGVTLTTTKNGTKEGDVTLGRNDIDVKLNGQIIEGDFLFQTAGDFEFDIASKAHPEATGKLTLHAVAVYSIANACPDKVVFEGLEEGGHHEGDAIAFTLRLLPGFYFGGTLTITDSDGEAVPFTEEADYHYSFTMPAKNVAIIVTANLTDFVITKDQEMIGNIIAEDATEEEGKDTFSAVTGTALKFKAIETTDFSFSKVFLDGEELAIGEDGFYHFVMPSHPIKITTDKFAREYSLTSNAADLTLSTTLFYTDEEAKTPITTAHKDQIVFIEFSYSVRFVKYQVSIKDAEGNSLEVTPVGDEGKVFSFKMISSEITIEITEEDYSKYHGFFIADKSFKLKNVYSGSNKLEEITKNGEGTTTTVDFYGNGKGYSSRYNDFTWDIEADGTSGHFFGYAGEQADSNKMEFYYTEHMLLTPYSKGTSAAWTDAFVGTWDDTATIHSLSFDGSSKKRIFWIEDEEHNIEEKLLVSDGNVYTDFSLFSDAQKITVAKGSDLTTESNFWVVIAEDNQYEVANGELSATYQLTSTESTQGAVTFKNAAGDTITSAKNGETVTISLSWLVENPDLSFKEPKLTTTAGGSISLTKVDDLTYTFKMPKGNVNVELVIRDLSAFRNHPALGKYVGYELWSSTIGDKDLSGTSPTKYSYEILESGEFKIGTSTNEISEITSGERGTVKVGSSTYTYGKGALAAPWRSAINDTYIAVRIEEGEDASQVTTKVHWMNAGKSWAVEFYVNSVLRAGIFATNETYYCGVTFEMTGTSTRIETDATYNVKMGGETIFTVANNEVTAA